MRTHPGRLTLGVALLATSVALAAAGCGGDDDQEPGVAGTAGTRGFSVEFAQAYCRALAPCCTFGGYGFSTSACEFSVSGYLDALIATFDEYPGVALDEDAGRTCAEAFRTAKDWQCQSKYCEGDVCRDWSLAKPSTCAGLLDF